MVPTVSQSKLRTNRNFVAYYSAFGYWPGMVLASYDGQPIWLQTSQPPCHVSFQPL